MNDSSVCKDSNFQRLYDNHMVDVRNFLYYKTGELELAEDLAQESFIKMWENCANVIYDKAKSFLFTVGNRLFLNKVRHDKVKLTFQKTQGVMESSNQENPQFVIEEKEFKEKLELAISNLPEKQREVFLMNRIDKLSYVEIAKTLDISVKAVEKRMGLCLKTLKEKVQELNSYKI